MQILADQVADMHVNCTNKYEPTKVEYLPLSILFQIRDANFQLHKVTSVPQTPEKCKGKNNHKFQIFYDKKLKLNVEASLTQGLHS